MSARRVLLLLLALITLAACAPGDELDESSGDEWGVGSEVGDAELEREAGGSSAADATLARRSARRSREAGGGRRLG